jgi:glycosyltransferase involved in cell wall biosynthesis
VLGNDRVIFAPNGVDTRHYRSEVNSAVRISSELTEFKEKYSNIIGYFGAIAPWLWYEVIADLAKLRPDLGFVFIGPDYNSSIGNLPKLGNILYLGEVDYKILPAYARKFDVCFIPFAPGDIARTTSPLKLFEYFALEKPVVVTSGMLECIAFEEVFSGDSAESLSEAIDHAIEIKSDAEYVDRLRVLASDNDWSERVRAMGVLFDHLSK